jgi:hypothetical protein
METGRRNKQQERFFIKIERPLTESKHVRIIICHSTEQKSIVF